MINADDFAELAEHFAKMRHVLTTAAKGRDADYWSGPVRKAMENLERCVRRSLSSLLVPTSDIRIIRCIESRASEHDPGENQPGSTKECLIAWRAEIQEILRAFEVCDCQVTVASV